MGVILAEKVDYIERDSSHGLHNVVTSQAGKELINEIMIWLYYAPRYPSIRLDCSVAPFPGSKIYTAANELHGAKLNDTTFHEMSGIEKPPATHENSIENQILTTRIVERNITLSAKNDHLCTSIDTSLKSLFNEHTSFQKILSM